MTLFQFLVAMVQCIKWLNVLNAQLPKIAWSWCMPIRHRMVLDHAFSLMPERWLWRMPIGMACRASMTLPLPPPYYAKQGSVRLRRTRQNLANPNISKQLYLNNRYTIPTTTNFHWLSDVKNINKSCTSCKIYS